MAAITGNARHRSRRCLLKPAATTSTFPQRAVKRWRLPNVICLLPGSSDKVIIVGAHFDRVSEGDGVVDNWSGASLLPSLYEAVKSEPRKHTYTFIGFTDEEVGEVGSRLYVRQMTKEQVFATEAMVNMDTLGLTPTEIWSRFGQATQWCTRVRCQAVERAHLGESMWSKWAAQTRSSLPRAKFPASRYIH
jgi:peptidase M28-like protein